MHGRRPRKSSLPHALLLWTLLAGTAVATASAGGVGVRIQTHPAALTGHDHATFGFTVTRGAKTLCRLDDRPFRRCTSPVTFDGLRDGRHTFRVTATAGGATASDAFRFVVDTQAPSRPQAGGGSLTWRRSALTLCGSGAHDANGIGSYQYRERVGTGAWMAPHGGRCVVVRRTGSTHAQFRAIDAAGNRGAWSLDGNGSVARVDMVAPSAPDLISDAEPGLCSESPLSFLAVAADVGSGVGSYGVRLRLGGGSYGSASGFGAGVPVVDALPGVRTYRVWAVDVAGNLSAFSTITLCID